MRERFITEPNFTPVDFDPFAGPAIARTAPSTEAQREVWVASQMSTEASCAYIESVSLELEGPLDRTLMERTIQQLVERHEGLRSTISADGMRVIVQEAMEVPFTFADLSTKSDAERAKELQALADRDMSAPFDLLHGPLFRTHLIKTGTDKHLLRLSGHHVIMDGWSLGIIMADVSRIYTALQQGTEPKLPQVFGFSEYAIAQIDFAKSAEHKQVEQYWLDLFKGPIPRVDLPTDRPRPKQKTVRGQRLDLEMDPALVRRLREVATRSGASFVTTLLTSFELLIHKLTGDSDLVVGLPAAGQSDFGMKDLVGHCVNLLALRSRIDEEQPFIDHLKARRTAVLDAFDNQKYSFGTLVRKLNVPREPGRIPLCPVVFNIDMNMDDGVAFAGIKHRFISNPRKYEHFELFLNATGNEEGLVLEWSYNTDLFDEGTVRDWMAQFTALVDRICTRPSAAIGELKGTSPLDGDQEMPQAPWHGQAPAYPKMSIGELFEEVAKAHAERVAVELNDQRISYAELGQRVNALSNVLVGMGIKPGDPVGLCVDRSFDMVVAMLATLRAGGCFVPFDPAYPADRLAFMFSDTNVKVMLTQRHLAGALPKNNAMPDGGQARIIFLDEVSSGGEHVMPQVTPDMPAYIMYTSGSTGTPKGVVVPHRAIVRLVREQNFLQFGPDLCWLQLSNISFDASTLEIWGPLLNGGRLVLQAQQKPTLPEICDTIQKHKVTSVWFTVGLFNMLVDSQLERLKGLRHILTGGDVLSVPHVKKALKALGPNVLINGYGPTENTTFTCCYPINDEASLADGVPIGFPLNNTTVHVLDEDLNPVAVGRKGELYTGGDGVALGYWKRKDLTSERFINDPFSGNAGAKLYRTGDLVKWRADGSIAFIGRADGQVKIRGFRIELGEIENAIAEVPGVKDRVVIARNAPQGEKQLVAYVVPKQASSAEEQAVLMAMVRSRLRERLPGHMIPTAFVVLPELPLTANGKVDRRALPDPEVRQQLLRAEHVAPRDIAELKMAGIWSAALNTQGIGIHDNFFDLGGHSLIGIQVLSQVAQQFGRQLPLSALFEAPTIAEFTRSLKTNGAGANWKNLAAIQPLGELPALFCVHGDEANHFIPRYLGMDHPFYAFFHQGEDGSAIEHVTVEKIAEHFIGELKQARPNGPYLLCGYSFGGIVAYEMAQQLRAAGDEVPMLVLFDTYAPRMHMEAVRSDRKFYDWIKSAVYRKMIKRELAQGHKLSPRLRHFHIIDTYDRAVNAYSPSPMDGPITVFKARNSWGAETMGWNELTKGQLEVNVVPGDHYSMIKEPHVKELVKALASSMDSALKRNTVDAV
ncbi:MAG: amino acid adenylation domain-containing protein [Flavobacteriales bacterium]|nr:amino acid adenylation domain-containing protein [Flavobacteriales bacterium]